MIVTLPWPDKGLSPNARLHWRPLADLKALARADAAKEVLAQMPLEARQAVASGDGRIALTIRFYPPDKRLRDDDNAVSAFKSARDGIADALKVNDRRFQPHYHFEDPAKPGRVEVEL